MTKQDIADRMKAAGLPAPRVILHRDGTGAIHFDLICGDGYGERRSKRVPKNVTLAKVGEMIALLNG